MLSLCAIEWTGKFLWAINAILLHAINFVCNGLHRNFFVGNQVSFVACKIFCVKFLTRKSLRIE